MDRKKLSIFLLVCGWAMISAFIIKLVVYGIAHILTLEKFLFSILENILPAIIFFIVRYYINRHSKNNGT